MAELKHSANVLCTRYQTMSTSTSVVAKRSCSSLEEKCFDVILPTVRDVLQNFWWSHSNEHPLLLLQQMQTHFGLFLRLYNGTEPCQKAITKLKTCKM